MLGPPVCIDCERIYDYLNEQESQDLRKVYPYIGRWWCSKCKSYDTEHTILTVSKEMYEKCIKNKED
jgi:hypothetical protein